MMTSKPAGAPAPENATVAAGTLAPWEVGTLPPPPLTGWRTWAALLGPGVVLAGASVGTGEWLFGPAVTAQYGATLLWLATISILCQVFCNLEMMRYTLYCGEPIVVGYFRTFPNARFWTCVYAFLDLGGIWPYNASNAAVPLAAALLGHLPSAEATVSFLGLFDVTENGLVKILGYVIFMSAFIPVIFGGAIYRMMERIMLFKLVVVLGYLGFVAVYMVSGKNAAEVGRGFVDFGTVPLRAETVVVDRGYVWSRVEGDTVYTLKGVIEQVEDERGEKVDKPLWFELVVRKGTGKPTIHKSDKSIPEDGRTPNGVLLLDLRQQLLKEAAAFCQSRGKLLVRDYDDYDPELPSRVLIIEGSVEKETRAWQPQRFVIEEGGTQTAVAHVVRGEWQDALATLPAAAAEHFASLVEHKGHVSANLFAYVRENGRLPNLDWMMLASFAAIAGAGGLTNTLFSNYARDKGWGMGAHVGAIPSAVGGKNITLSHVGQVFRVNEISLIGWRAWFRHIVKDQFLIWMFCSFVGMALPCMLSLEFIRNVPVSGDRAAAASAQGIADRFVDAKANILGLEVSAPACLYFVTLLCGFLILAPGQISAGDQISRRWTDILWVSSPRVQSMRGNQVKYVYYGILSIYFLWGMLTLYFFDPLQTAKIGTSIQNVALGFSAVHTLVVNRTLLPRQLKPNLFMQLGLVTCGVFFFGISAVVLWSLWL